MTPLQELTKKIQAYCPELLELTFGCEIIVAGIAKDNPGCERDVVLYGTQEQRDKGFIATEYYGQVHISEIESILGNPITLEYVLKAIAKSTLEYIRVTVTQTESIGMIVAIDIGSGREFWTLGKPLHLQSEPLIKWLNTIIK